VVHIFKTGLRIEMKGISSSGNEGNLSGQGRSESISEVKVGGI